MAKTLGEVIAFVDGIKPNAYEASVKTQWINEIEGTLQTEVFRISIQDIVEYDFPSDRDTELIADAPHNKLYWMYLCAMIDFANGEYSKYNNSMAMFNEAYDEYAKWVCRTYSLENDEDTGYCLSAYGIAKKHGFEGTEEEWIASLREASEAAAAVANTATAEAYAAAREARDAASSITSHTNNTVKHVTAADKSKWNAYQDILQSGGITQSYLADGSVTSEKLAENVLPAKTSQLQNDGEDGADKYATCEYVKNAVDDGIRKTDAMIYKGTVSSQADLPQYGFDIGWTYKATGSSGIYFGERCENGDMLIATKRCDLFDENKSYMREDFVYYEGSHYIASRNVEPNKGFPDTNTTHWTRFPEPYLLWDVVQSNLDGAVIGPSSSFAGNIAVFADDTGKLLGDGRVYIEQFVYPDPISVPTNSAVYSYAQPKTAKVTKGTNIRLADNTEYRLTDVTTLTLTYPTGNFECWMSLSFADEGDITVTLPASSYIGAAPVFANGEKWEMSIKDGVIVSAKVGDGT